MSNRLPVIFIFATLVIDAMGIGLIIPVMPSLIREVTGGDLANAAIWGGVLSTSFAVMQFLFGPAVGNLSDRFGRRPVLLYSMAAMAIDYVVMALAGSIWLLLAGRVFGGILAATQSTANAFMADISKPEDKAANFGLLGAAFGIGFVLGPLIGGVLAGFDTRAPFWAAAAIAGLNFALGYFVLPETVTDRIRRPFEWRRANPFGAFRYIGRLPGVGRLLLLFFLYEFAFFVFPAIWAYFSQARFGWSEGMVGVSLASFGIAIAVVQGLLMRPILARFGHRGTVIFGFSFNLASFLFLAVVTNGTLALIMTPLTALGAITTPALQAMASHKVGDDQQGELQGAITSIRSVAVILSPLAMTQTFAIFSGQGYPSAPFLLSAAIMTLCIVVFVTRKRPQ